MDDRKIEIPINPIFGPNKMKLGIFGLNGKGTANTLVPEFHKPTWKANLAAARLADDAGFEAIVPYARWKGHELGKPDHPSNIVLDPFTWAAGIAQATKHSAIFVTTHAATYHPITVAKQTATIDLISGGRFGINVVAGWNRPELEMFGASLREHEERYKHLAEWMDIITRLWSEVDEFDYNGAFFKIVNGASRPQPLQKPRPPIMNAASSGAGQDFATRVADMCFVQLPSEDPAKRKAQIDSYKSMAREKYGREIQVWTMATIVQRETQAEAEAYLKHYAVDNADVETVDAWAKTIMANARPLTPFEIQDRRMRGAAGAGGTILVGDAGRITEQIESLSASGLDGMLIGYVDFADGIKRLVRDVFPKLEAKGLRTPFRPAEK
jgi:alkanesulfonate monooxygenase SsuD/methylene tetrahydromethanopterin reductase-like flavin-dependent oxidoreductase (luciferase family)